jgi:hypothetical protein
MIFASKGQLNALSPSSAQPPPPTALEKRFLTVVINAPPPPAPWQPARRGLRTWFIYRCSEATYIFCILLTRHDLTPIVQVNRMVLVCWRKMASHQRRCRLPPLFQHLATLRRQRPTLNSRHRRRRRLSCYHHRHLTPVPSVERVTLTVTVFYGWWETTTSFAPRSFPPHSLLEGSRRRHWLPSGSSITKARPRTSTNSAKVAFLSWRRRPRWLRLLKWL